MITAHQRAVLLATNGTVLKGDGAFELGGWQSVVHRGRSPKYSKEGEDEVHDVPFAADISVRDSYNEFV